MSLAVKGGIRWSQILPLILIGLALLSLNNRLDTYAASFVDGNTEAALAVFATARVLDAGVSVLQGTRLSVSFGVGAELAVGEMLDPLNDMLERFSEFMTWSLTASGLMKLMLSLACSDAFKWLLLLLAVAFLVSAWLPKFNPRWLHVVLLRMVLLGLVLRYAFAGLALANQWLYQGFLQNDYQRLEQQFSEKTESVVGKIALDQGLGVESSGTSMLETLRQNLGVDHFYIMLQQMRESAGHLIDNMLKLILIFAVTTLLLPLAFLLILYRLVIWLFKVPIPWPLPVSEKNQSGD